MTPSTPITYRQPDQLFTGPAYEYLKADDQLPNYDALPAENVTCRVKLFLPVGRMALYVAAATDYDGQIVLTGFMVSPLGPDCDEFGDSAMDELASLRTLGLPIERDLDFTPQPLAEIERRVADGNAP